MAYTRTQAKTLLNASELALFDDGRAVAVKAHTAAQLRNKIQRSRRLRDKYRDLFRRQRLDSRQRTGSKDGRSGQANARSSEKATLFDELMGRFQARLTVLEAAEARANGRKKASTRKATAKKATAKATAKATTGKKATAKKATAKKATAKKATAKTTTAKKATAKKATAKKTAAKKATARKAATSRSGNRRAAAGNGAAEGHAATKRSARTAGGAGQVDTTTRAARLPDDNAVGKAQGTPRGVNTPPVQDAPPRLPDALAANASPSHGGFVDERARQVAQERHFATSGVKTIHAHISSRDRRKQGRRDDPEE